MSISSIKNSINFGSKNIFRTSLVELAKKKPQMAIPGFISELTPADIKRPDLKSRFWNRTKYGGNIIEDYQTKATGRYTPNSTISPEDDVRFFATEITDKHGNTKAITLGEAKVRGSFICLDRLQSLKSHCKTDIKGGGSGIIYAVVDLAKKLDKDLVTLESHKNAIPFYRRLGMQEFQNGNLVFFRVFKPQYEEFLQRLGKKFSIKPAENINIQI